MLLDILRCPLVAHIPEAVECAKPPISPGPTSFASQTGTKLAHEEVNKRVPLMCAQRWVKGKSQPPSILAEFLSCSASGVRHG